MVVQSQGITSTVIRYGDAVYVQHMSGAYMSPSAPPKPDSTLLRARMSVTEDVALPIQIQLLGGNGEIRDGDVVQIQSTETQWGDRTTLELGKDRQDCFYQPHRPNTPAQEWTIHKRYQNGDQRIYYGDEVYVQNVLDNRQRLARSAADIGGITVFREANEWWGLHQSPESELTTSSEGRFLQAQFAPHKRGLHAGNMAYLAYCAETVYSEAVKSKAELERLGLSIQGQEHFFDFSDNTQAIVVGDADKIVVSFRGTQNLKDWRTNLKLRKSQWQVGRVHRGFNQAIQSAWPDLLERIKALRTDEQPIWFTGHSLGGALATVACATLSRDADHDYEIGGIYTFGQPRVGDGTFARAFRQSLQDRSFRVVNNNDLVARMPRVNYKHVGQLLYFDTRGEIHSNVVLSWLSLSAIKYRFQGYADSFMDFDSDALRDHRMGTYRLLTMRQLAG